MDVNWKLLLLGALPPLLAIVGELRNPVSARKAKVDAQQPLDAAIKGAKNDMHARNRAGNVLERTVEGALQTASLLPTWIAVNAGIAGILAEMFSPAVGLSVTLVIVALTAILLPRFFSRVDYYALAEFREGATPPAPGARRGGFRAWISRPLGSTHGERIQRLVVYANGVVIAFAFVAALVVEPSSSSHHGQPSSASAPTPSPPPSPAHP